MNMEDLVESLVNGFINSTNKSERDDYRQRLRDLSYALQTNTIATGPTHNKRLKEVLKDFERLAPDVYFIIAIFLPYKDITSFMLSNSTIYTKLAPSDLFWRSKFKYEFSGFVYPPSFEPIPKDYLVDELISVYFSVGEIISREKRKTLLDAHEWFRKTRYFLSRIFEFNKKHRFIGSLSARNMDKLQTRAKTYLYNLGSLADTFFGSGNESAVVSLIKHYNASDVFPYLEFNKNLDPSEGKQYNIDYRVLLEWAYQRNDNGVRMFLRYTQNRLYYFDRRSFIMELLELGLEVDLYEMNDGYSFIRNDKEIMMKIFYQQGEYKFSYLGKELKDDSEFLLEVAKKISPSIFDEASQRLRRNKIFCINILKIGKTIDYFCDELNNDKEYVWEAFKINQSVLYRIGEELQNNHPFLLELLKRYHEKLDYISLHGFGAFKNKDFVLEAVKIDGNLIQVTDLIDYEIAKEAIKTTPAAIWFVDTDLMKKIPNLYLSAFSRQPTLFNDLFYMLDAEAMTYILLNSDWEQIFRVLPEEKLEIPFVILTVLKRDIRAIEYASEKLKKDMDFVREAIKINPKINPNKIFY